MNMSVIRAFFSWEQREFLMFCIWIQIFFLLSLAKWQILEHKPVVWCTDLNTMNQMTNIITIMYYWYIVVMEIVVNIIPFLMVRMINASINILCFEVDIIFSTILLIIFNILHYWQAEFIWQYPDAWDSQQ